MTTTGTEIVLITATKRAARARSVREADLWIVERASGGMLVKGPGTVPRKITEAQVREYMRGREVRRR
jgi:hypothetical protein